MLTNRRLYLTGGGHDRYHDPRRTARFRQELLAIREDPKVRNFALARAGDPDLAKDALHETYCAVLRVRIPSRSGTCGPTSAES